MIFVTNVMGSIKQNSVTVVTMIVTALSTRTSQATVNVPPDNLDDVAPGRSFVSRASSFACLTRWAKPKSATVSINCDSAIDENLGGGVVQRTNLVFAAWYQSLLDGEFTCQGSNHRPKKTATVLMMTAMVLSMRNCSMRADVVVRRPQGLTASMKTATDN